jgi:hypothetical protein
MGELGVATSGRTAQAVLVSVALGVVVAACLTGSAAAARVANVPAAVQCPASPHCWAGTITLTEVIDATLVEPGGSSINKATNKTTVTVDGAGAIVQHESPNGSTVFGGETGTGSASLNIENTATNSRCPPDGSEGVGLYTLTGSVDGVGRVLVIPNDEDHPTSVTIGGGVDTNVPTTSTERCNTFLRSTPSPGGAFSTQAVVDLPSGWDGLHLRGTRTEHVGDYAGMHDRTITWDLTRNLRPGCPAVSFEENCTTSSNGSVAKGCKTSSAATDHTFKSYVPKEGVGLVAWRANLAVIAKDRCDHGALTINFSWDKRSLASKNGKLLIISLEYKTTLSSGWRTDGLLVRACATDSDHGCFRAVEASHIDLSRTTRITLVRIKTALAFSDVTSDDKTAPYLAAYRSWTCDTRTSDCSAFNGR